MSTGTVIKLDNVSYGSFPRASYLGELSSNLIRSFIDFLRSIGICGLDGMKNALPGSSEEEVEYLFLKCHINAELNSKNAEQAIKQRKQWQKKALKTDRYSYFIDLKAVVESAKKRTSFYRLDAIEKEVYNLLMKKRREQTKKLGIENPSKTVQINDGHVKEILSACELAPIHSWAEASEDPEYIDKLLNRAFPHAPVSIVARYLFTEDSVTPTGILGYCRSHRIIRLFYERGCIYDDEIVAFIKWAGGNLNDLPMEELLKRH